MALSENEQKLADKLKGKIIYREKTGLADIDPEYVFSINEHGMIVSSYMFRNEIFPIPRSQDYYAKQYERYVLEDNLSDFKPSFKFKTYSFIYKPMLELYKKDNISLMYDIESNLISLETNDNTESLSNDKIDELNLSTETIDKLEKYKNSIDSVIEDLHNQYWNEKEVIKNIRTRYAYNMVKYQTSKYSYQTSEASEELPLLKEFYEELKSNLSAEELEEEDRLFNEEYNKEVERAESEKANDEKFELEKIEGEKKEVKEKIKDLDKLKKLINKVYLDKTLSIDNIAKLLYVDENGIVSTKNGTYLHIHNFSHSFVEPDDFIALDEAFSQKDFVGKKLKSEGLLNDEALLLFKNDTHSIVGDLNDDKIWFTIRKNSDMERVWKEYPIDSTAEDKKFADALAQFSDINNVISYIDEDINKRYSNYIIRKELIDELASNICQLQGKSDFVNLDSSYSNELDNNLAQAFAEYWIKENNYSKEDIDNFYNQVEIETNRRIRNYDDQEKENEINHIKNKEQNEQKIADVVADKLGLKPKQKETSDNSTDFTFTFKPEKPAVVSHRKKFELTDDIFTVLYKLSEGNPGAINVLSKILNGNMTKDMDEKLKAQQVMKNMLKLLSFDDMNIRGSQIWILYKNIYGIDCDIFDKDDQAKFNTLTEKIYNHDKEVVDKINDYSKKHHLKDKAVISGASYIIANGNDATSLYFDESEFEPIVEKAIPDLQMAKPKKSLIQKLKGLIFKGTKNANNENNNDDEIERN